MISPIIPKRIGNAKRHWKKTSTLYLKRMSSFVTLLFRHLLLLENTSSKFLYVNTPAHTDKTMSTGIAIIKMGITLLSSMLSHPNKRHIALIRPSPAMPFNLESIQQIKVLIM